MHFELESDWLSRFVLGGFFGDDGRDGTGTRSAASTQRLAAPKLSSETSTSTLKTTKKERKDDKKATMIII